MKRLAQAGSTFDDIMKYGFRFSVLLIAFMMAVVLAEIIGRLVWKPITGATELVELCLLQVTFWGAAWVQRNEKHISIDMVLNYLKPKAKAVVNIVGSIISAVLFLVLAWYGVMAMYDSFRLGYGTLGVINVPKYILLLTIPVGSTLMFIQLLRKAHQHFREARMLVENEL